jgi:hypothetical protein
MRQWKIKLEFKQVAQRLRIWIRIRCLVHHLHLIRMIQSMFEELGLLELAGQAKE